MPYIFQAACGQMCPVAGSLPPCSLVAEALNDRFGAKAIVWWCQIETQLLADSTHRASFPVAAAPIRTKESDSDQRSRSLSWKS
jgi:hypothetical protein